MQELTLDPSRPNLSQTFTLDGDEYVVRFQWRDRPRSWYVDVRRPDGTEVALGRRVAANAIIVPDMDRDLADSPGGGVLYGFGKDHYAREDLGKEGGIRVIFFTRQEFDGFDFDSSEDVLVA